MSLMNRMAYPSNIARIPDRRPTKVAYALPTFFTAGNMFLGFVAIMKCFEGALAAAAGGLGPNIHFQLAAQMIGMAVLLDGLDGRIARMTNTTSDFGREMDSLADAITFGIAPAVLGFSWGFHFVDTSGHFFLREHLMRIGYFVSFIFALCGSARLARFNVQTNVLPKNPGRADRKYFVGLPIPAAAGLVAAIVYATDSDPIVWWPFAIAWLALLALLSFLMVSTWRYRSFKDLNMMRPRSPLLVIVIGSILFLTWNYSQAMLLSLGVLYVGSGIAVRLGGLLQRRFRTVGAAS